MWSLRGRHVRFSPIYFKKIARFNYAANLILSRPETPLTGIGYECGYYDQAHFIKDFKEFGGITPSQFLHLQAKSSDFYNFTLKDIDSFGD
jgi:AraC-like DNA-binding protein